MPGPNQHTLTTFYSLHTRKMGRQRLHDIQDSHGGSNSILNFSALQGHVYRNQYILKIKSEYFIDMLDTIYHLSQVNLLWYTVQKIWSVAGNRDKLFGVAQHLIWEVTIWWSSLPEQATTTFLPTLHTQTTLQHKAAKLTTNSPSTGVRHESM